MLVTIGGACIGLVWGWLLAALGARARKRRRAAVLRALATLALAAVILALAGWPAPALFLGATALTFWLHLAWRESLESRYGPSAVEFKEVTHA